MCQQARLSGRRAAPAEHRPVLPGKACCLAARDDGEESMERMGHCIRLRPDKVEEYKRLHILKQSE
jgi:hypothetical protein